MAWQGAKPSDFAKQILKDADDHTKKVCIAMLQGVIMGSPVMDAVYRSNHRLSVNGQVFYTVPTTGNTAPKGNIDEQVLQDGLKELLKFKLGDVVYIQNNSVHGLRLENGWSQQAPQGVYSLTFQAVSSKYP